MSGNAAAALIQALTLHVDGAGTDWDAFALFLEFDSGKFNASYGYTYGPGGSVPVSVRPRLVRAEVDACLAGYRSVGPVAPVKILARFDRRQGRYDILFEDHDLQRWRVTPENLDHVIEALRPAFD